MSDTALTLSGKAASSSSLCPAAAGERAGERGPQRPAGGTVWSKKRCPRAVGGAALGQDVSREARRQAAAILEVLSGARTPAEAAAVLAVSVPRYYQIESRAVRGLLAACAGKTKGRVGTAESALTALRQQHARLQRELARQQALARMAQRTIGLAPPAPVKPVGKKPRRPKVARALSVAARLQKDDTVPAATPAARDTV